MLHVIGYVVVGLLAGVVAGRLMSGRGFGLWVDLGLGLVGGLLGGLLFGVAFGSVKLNGIGEALAAIFVACLAVAILHLVRRDPLATE
ncbi:MAG: GlsB/YeaQ/YmgE family stress response membrane protein [Candidatus Dormiibacterota bacterium]